jgi:acyl-CoA-binding protein
MINLEDEFMEISEKIKKLKLSDETKLKFYGLYKMATVGKYEKKSVGMFDFTEKYKKYK